MAFSVADGVSVRGSACTWLEARDDSVAITVSTNGQRNELRDMLEEARVMDWVLLLQECPDQPHVASEAEAISWAEDDAFLSDSPILGR